MSIRWKDGRPVVEIYDPATKRKRHVKAADFDMPAPRTERQAKALERAALNARDQERGAGAEESCDSFAARWAGDFRRTRGEATRAHNHERVQAFGREHAGRALRSVTSEEALSWAQEHPGTVPALRAMFNDALRVKLVDENPFAKLGLEQSKGREGVTPLTGQEVERLRELAMDVHGELFGPEVAALIGWSAYTCMRPGESFAARHSLLDGDVYHLRAQYNSKLRKETVPKHEGVGSIYVPDMAARAVLEKPRRLGDDLMFRTKRGRQFRQEALHRAWVPVRSAFMATLPKGHHLWQRLALDPDDRLDFYELRHFGASHMLNELGIEPWVIALQLRHSDGGALVVKLYGHPSREKAIDVMRRAYTAKAPRAIGGAAASRAVAVRGNLGGAG